MIKRRKLKAPFPYFGGKSRVASLVWDRLGDVDNFIEPFMGSAAALLARPHAPRVETVNDADCYVANFWRATSAEPHAVAAAADWPVNEADLHARHRWLVLSEKAAAFRLRMRRDPHHFDPVIAGWWCWGLCCWIGGGWCQAPEDRQEGDRVWKNTKNTENAPAISHTGKAINGKATTCEEERRPVIDHCHGPMSGVASNNFAGQGRPQLADAYDIGRGVNGNGALGTCAQRLAWLQDWFGRLRDRLRTVRVCCGDWLRVCDSESVTTRLGVTGVFFDPPYSAEAGRHNALYACESGTVAHDVRAYCLDRGGNPLYRIALCGYDGEGHEELEARGWERVRWKAQGGYGNRSKKGKDNSRKEAIWFSPHCEREPTLFDLSEGAS